MQLIIHELEVFMKKWWISAVIGCLAGMAATADEVVLFSAANAGPDAWSWEGARLTGQENGLILSKDKGENCSVVLEDRFALVPGAQIQFDVQKVVAGSYALQVLAFKGTTYLGSIDLVKDSAEVGAKAFELGKLALPADTETITFKLWISKDLGSAVQIKDLTYSLLVTPEQVVYDKFVGTSTAVQTDQAVWTPGEQGGKLALNAGVPHGSIVFTDQIQKPVGGTLLIQVSDLKNGTLTVQACAFNANGEYLSSIDLMKRGTASLSMNLASVPWPEGAATFQIKLWLGGSPDTSAVISRLLVLK
jgi:hypothetical protein